MRSSERLLLTLSVAVLGAAAPSAALATPGFPAAVASHLALEAPPPCTLCHVGNPARGTVVTAFGTTMRSRGLVAHDEGSLRTALDALAAERKDSDGDGTIDVRELREGTDPSAAPGAASDDLVPEYGCNASRVPSAATAATTHRERSTLALCFLAIGVAIARARSMARGSRRTGSQ